MSPVCYTNHVVLLLDSCALDRSMTRPDCTSEDLACCAKGENIYCIVITILMAVSPTNIPHFVSNISKCVLMQCEGEQGRSKHWNQTFKLWDGFCRKSQRRLTHVPDKRPSVRFCFHGLRFRIRASLLQRHSWSVWSTCTGQVGQYNRSSWSLHSFRSSAP
jgi:hypothetical protein